MSTLRERIANERRRLREVRQKLSAAIEQGSGGDADWVPFYIAVADYMEAAMQRLHAQDVKMGDMIRDKLGELDAAAEQALRELDERLSGNEQRLRALLAARDRLRSDGAAALPDFEAAAREFTAFIVANMGHHGATTDLAARLFSPADWEYMAGISDEELAREVALFERVTATTPPGLQPASDAE
ncbi:MAG: hypothetical protein D6727_06495 [Gammaproteobacteria bacterium]|nr:MAG: hypothetical protein D6727_06495 [Gammaproteobacteria bacterium]